MTTQQNFSVHHSFNYIFPMNIVSVRRGHLLLCMLLFAFQTTQAQSIEDALRKADTQFNLSAYNTALNSYSEVLKKDPNNAYAFGRKGDCYVQLNQPLEALPWFDRADRKSVV